MACGSITLLSFSMAPTFKSLHRFWKEISSSLMCMQVDQPLCYDCIHRVQDEVEVSIREAQQECVAYEAALARLRGDDTQPYTDEVGSACPNHPVSVVMLACTFLFLHLCLVVFWPMCCISKPFFSDKNGLPDLCSQSCLTRIACLAPQSQLAVAYS